MPRGGDGASLGPRKEDEMTTLQHEPVETSRWSARVFVHEMWASLAIIVMWLAVLFDAIYGPDIVTVNGAGTQSSTVPSAVAIALFAFLGTWVVARYGFRRERED
jgi:hypothetical protein